MAKPRICEELTILSSVLKTTTTATTKQQQSSLSDVYYIYIYIVNSVVYFTIATGVLRSVRLHFIMIISRGVIIWSADQSVIFIFYFYLTTVGLGVFEKENKLEIL